VDDLDIHNTKVPSSDKLSEIITLGAPGITTALFKTYLWKTMKLNT